MNLVLFLLCRLETGGNLFAASLSFILHADNVLCQNECESIKSAIVLCKFGNTKRLPGSAGATEAMLSLN